MIRLAIVAGLLVALLCPGSVWAGAATARRGGSDLQGREWKIPVEERATVVIFLHPGQKPSDQEVVQVRQDLLAAKEVAILGVVSGPEADQRARAVGEWEWPLLVDPDFSLSGDFDVHAWPTTIVFDAQGRLVGRIAGNPASLRGSLDAYLAYVSGSITQQQLHQELTRLQIVEDSGEQKAFRHLVLAQDFATSGRVEDAAAQLKQAQSLSPATEPVRMLMARDMLLLGDAKEADAVLAAIKEPSQAGEWELLSGWSAVQQGRWQEARERLAEAEKQALDPADRVLEQYWLGVVYQHNGDFARAAEAFRIAYESAAAAPAGTP